jgi:hypothetical protein
MKIFIALAAALVLIFSACKKETNEPDAPQPATSDTTQILTLIEEDYGNIDYATTRTLVSITGDNEAKYIITETSPSYPGDTSFIVYKLNAQNQLTEVTYTGNSDPSYYEHSIYTWTGNDLIKIEMDASDEAKHTYNFNYTSIGANTRITFTQDPVKHYDTLFNGDRVQYYDDYKTAFIVSTTDFKPVGIEAETYYYLSNNPANPPSVGRDTAYTNFVFSATGDLQQKIQMGSGVDSNANGNIGVIRRHKDSLTYNYTRDNSSNDNIANVFKSLLGNRLFALYSFYSNEFVLNDLIPQGFDSEFFLNHPLNKLSNSKYMWENGFPDNDNGQINDETKYENSYDSKNRLITARRINSYTNQAEYGFKIIWPE